MTVEQRCNSEKRRRTYFASGRQFEPYFLKLTACSLAATLYRNGVTRLLASADQFKRWGRLVSRPVRQGMSLQAGIGWTAF
eukprot:6477810-Amphidinium_carterae.1